MASDLRGYTADETLNKVLNTSNDSIQVDIVDATGVTITTSNESVYADDANWTDSTSKHTLVGGIYQSSPQSITNGDTGPLQVNAAGNLIVDVIGGGVLETLVDGVETLLGTIDGDTSTLAAAVDTQMQVDVVASLPAGSNTIGVVDLGSTDNAVLDAIAIDGDNIQTLLSTLDGVQDSALTKLGEIETTNNANQVLLGTIDADTNAMKIDLAALEVLQASTNTKLDTLETTLTAIETDDAAIEVLLTAANVDHAANEALLTGIDADTNAIKVDIAALEVLSTAANVDLAAIEVDLAAMEVLSTAANVDLAEIEVATEATQSALEKMLYGNALVITAVDGGSTQALGATYESLYVGVGGNVVVTMVGTGNFTFSNVASGQLLPIRITHVIHTNTTATNMIALKA